LALETAPRSPAGRPVASEGCSEPDSRSRRERQASVARGDGPGRASPGGRRWTPADGIHYYTLKGLIEGAGPDDNSYAIVEADTEFNLTVTGYKRAAGASLKPAGASS